MEPMGCLRNVNTELPLYDV